MDTKTCLSVLYFRFLLKTITSSSTQGCMSDRALPSTPAIIHVDEWHDASAENSPMSYSIIDHDRDLVTSTSKESKMSMQLTEQNGINMDLNVSPAPLCYEDGAIRERDHCEYSIRITLDMAKAQTAPRKIRVYADGMPRDRSISTRSHLPPCSRYLRSLSCWSCTTVNASQESLPERVFARGRL